MKIHPYPQGSAEWMLARAGIPTASEFKNLVTPLWKVRKGEMPLTYMAEKLAEWWLGGPLPGFGTWATEQGQVLEQEAIPWFELETGATVTRPGLITTDDGCIGCSPDGIIGQDFGLEVKCLEPTNHVKLLLTGDISDYLAQIHGGMLVTGFRKWVFLAYRRGFPNLILEIEHDEKIQQVLAEALHVWLGEFESGKMRLEELNGGPKRGTASTPAGS
jgi:hypothetical protein